MENSSQFPQYGQFINYTNDAVFNGVCPLCNEMIRDNLEVFAFHPNETGNLSKHIYHSDCLYKRWKEFRPIPGDCPTCKSSAPIVARINAVIQVLCRMLNIKRVEKRLKQWFVLGPKSNHWLVVLDFYVRDLVIVGKSEKIIPFFDWWLMKNPHFNEWEVFPLVLNKLRDLKNVQTQFLIKWAHKFTIVLRQIKEKYEKLIFKQETITNFKTTTMAEFILSFSKLKPIDTDELAESLPNIFSKNFQLDDPNDPYTAPIEFLIDRLDYIVVSGDVLSSEESKIKYEFSKHNDLIADCSSVYRINELLAKRKSLQTSVMDRLLKREINCLLIVQNGGFHLIKEKILAEPIANFLQSTDRYDRLIWYCLNQRFDISIQNCMAPFIRKFTFQSIKDNFHLDYQDESSIPFISVVLAELENDDFIVELISCKFEEAEWPDVRKLYYTVVYELETPVPIACVLHLLRRRLRRKK